MATIKFDFDAISERIKTNLRAKSEWAELPNTGTDVNLIDAIALEEAYCMNGDEYYTTENWWRQARNKSSLMVNAPMLGYKAPRKVGAVGYLKCSSSESFDTPPTISIPIAKWSEFSDDDGVTVVSTQASIISTSASYVEIPVVQGSYKTYSFIAQGDDFETYEIDSDSIENIYYELYVNNVLWTEVDSILIASEDDQSYAIDNANDFSTITLRFGNTYFGKKLVSGDEVVFKCVITDGDDGNINGLNMITNVDSLITNSSNEQVDIYCTNESSISGGADTVSLETIRETAPKIYQTGDRATSGDDYSVIISELSYITKVIVWGHYEYCIDNGLDTWTFLEATENTVKVSALNSSYENLSDNEKTSLIESIYEQKGPTDIVEFVDVEIINIYFTVEAKVLSQSYALAVVQANIIETLEDNYNIENIDFNENLPESDYKSLIDDVEGVDYHNTTISTYKDFEFSSSYAASVNLPIYPLDGVTLALYIRDTTVVGEEFYQIGESDSSGNITATLIDWNLYVSKVDVSTGEGQVVIIEGLSGNYENYELRFTYSGTSLNYTLNSRNSIFQYADSTVTTQYEELN